MTGASIKRIAVVAYPHISNLDEFQPLRNMPGVKLVWARQPADLDGAQWIILPGSKHTRADMQWMREQGLDETIKQHALQGRPVLGICGGLQMLGHGLHDPLGVEGLGASEPGSTPGLGLLPLQTHFGAHKSLKQTMARWVPADATLADSSIWQALHGVPFSGYEIHQGQTQWDQAAPQADAQLRDEEGHVLGWQSGQVMGLYAHGLFESPAVLRALFGQSIRTLDDVFDGLADFIDAPFQAQTLLRLLDR